MRRVSNMSCSSRSYATKSEAVRLLRIWTWLQSALRRCWRTTSRQFFLQDSRQKIPSHPVAQSRGDVRLLQWGGK